MNARKRLAKLEHEAALKLRQDRQSYLSLQRETCCPLPDGTTPEESAEALRLLTAGRDAVRVDINNHAPLLKLRDYAIRLHRKYGGPFAGEELSDA